MTDDDAAADTPRLGGLLDGRLEWAAARGGDVVETLRTGMVVIDANVLLHLYRYGSEARGELLESLRLVGERLFVPDRVAIEFLRNRAGTAIDEYREIESKIKYAREAMEEARTQLLKTGRTRGLGHEQQSEVREAFRLAESAVVDHLQRSLDDRSWALKPSDEDPILTQLAEVLVGKVGLPYAADDYAKHVAEGKRRVQDEIPPGFADKKKPEPWGDFLVWRQTLDEAKVRGLPVLFVSDDVKDDWYLRSRGITVGPQPGLIREAREEAGVVLHLRDVPSFLGLARDHLAAEVSEETLREATEEAAVARRFEMKVRPRNSAGNVRRMNQILLRAYNDSANSDSLLATIRAELARNPGLASMGSGIDIDRLRTGMDAAQAAALGASNPAATEWFNSSLARSPALEEIMRTSTESGRELAERNARAFREALVEAEAELDEDENEEDD